MHLKDLLTQEASYLLEKSEEKYTGGIIVMISMNQGGFQPPKFMPFKQENGQVSTAGLKFMMVE